jgi:hypothetical protein
MLRAGTLSHVIIWTNEYCLVLQKQGFNVDRAVVNNKYKHPEAVVFIAMQKEAYVYSQQKYCNG